MDSFGKISPLWICLVVMCAILSPGVVHAETCETGSESSTGGGAGPDVVLPAMSLAAADGTRVEIQVRAATTPIRIQLLPSPTAIADGDEYYEIVLGNDATSGAYPYDAGTGATIARVQNGDVVGTPESESTGVASGLSASVYDDFFIRVETNPSGTVSVGIGDAGDTGDFITFPPDSNPIQVSSIGFTGDGNFIVCDPIGLDTGLFEVNNDAATSTTTDLTDGTTDNCEESTGDSTISGFVVYLDGEYEVVGVRLQHDPTDADLETAKVRVGNCGYVDKAANFKDATISDIDANVDCTGGGYTADDLYRVCPMNTYGNVIYIYRSDGTKLSICEVSVYAIKRPDNEKTTVSFQSATESVTEEDGATVLTKSITLTRTGVSTDNPTCTIARVYSTSDDLTLSTGCGSAGDDIAAVTSDLSSDANSAVVVFEADAAVTTKNLDLTICGDYASEGDEFALLGFDEQDYTACSGATPTTRLTITDDDPDYYFQQLKYEGNEVTSTTSTVTFTVIKTGYLLDETTICIVTADGSATTATNDYVEQTGTCNVANQLLTFTAGDQSETATVTIMDDTEGEGTQDFSIGIYEDDDGNGVWMPFSSETVTNGENAEICIVDNEPAFQFQTQDASNPAPFEDLETNQQINVVVENVGSTAIGGTVRVTASVGGSDTATEGSDFQPFTTDVVFAPGDTSKVVPVPIINDVDMEVAETFTLTLESATGEASLIVDDAMEYLATLTINDDDATVYMAVSTQDVTERDGNAEIIIMRDSSGYLARSAWVDLQILFGTATSPDDYTEPDVVRVYFNEGADSTSLQIPIVDDREVEENETFTVTIVGADNPIHVTDKVTTVNIQSDDALIWIVQTPDEVIEGEIFTVTIMREGGDGFLHEVHLNTNSDIADGATAGDDFEVLSMPVLFNGDETSKDVQVQTYEDGLIEETESFRVSISEPNEVIDETRDSIIVDILDDDSLIGFTRLSYEVTETTGSDTVVSVSLTRGGDLSNSATVVLSTVEINGAQAGSDFAPLSSLPVTFLANSNTVSQDITIEADSTPEFAEIFQVIVRSDTSGGLDNIDPNRSAANVTIVDDDSGSFRFENTAYEVDEGQGLLNVRILRPGATAGYVTLLVTVSPGTATYPDDYRQEEILVEFAPGQDEATVSIVIVADDDTDEGDETFALSLSLVSQFGTVDPNYDEATVTILDSESAFSLSTNSPNVVESAPGYVEITIRRSGSTNTDTHVSLRTVDGTATHSGDFEGFNIKTFSFPSGTGELTFRIPIDDNDFEEDTEETFSVYILSDGGQVIQDSQLVITIIDDDGYYFFVPLSNEDREDGIVTYRTTEDSGTVLIKVQRTGNNNGYGSVRATTTDDSAEEDSDYQPLNGRVISFQPAVTTKEFPVTIINDDNRENEESFYIELSLARNGAVIEPRKALVIIESNDRNLRKAEPLSPTAVIGIGVGVGGLVIIATVAGIAFCILLRPARRVPVQRKPPMLRGPGPVPQYGVPFDPRITRVNPYPYQGQVPGFYPI